MSIDKTSGEEKQKDMYNMYIYMHNFIMYHIDESSCFDIHGWPLSPQKVKPMGDSLAAGTPRRKGMGAKTLGKMNSVQHLFHGAMVFVGDNGENCELKQGSTWI